MKFAVTLIFLLFFYCCQNTATESNIEKEIITKKSFPKSKKLVGKIIKTVELLTPFRYNILRDSLLFVENYTPDPYYFEIFHLKTNEKIAEFGVRGKGPDELLSGKLLSNAINSLNQNEIIIHDVVAKKVLRYSIDSLILGKKQVKISQTEIPAFATNFYKLDNKKFLCYNSYFFNHSAFNNEIDKLFVFSGDTLKIPDVSNCIFFTFNVSGAVILSSPNRDKIIVADEYSSRLEWYNEELKLIKRVEGPNMADTEYRLMSENNVFFKKGKSFFGYSEGIAVGNSVYLIYEGVRSYYFEDPTTLPKVQVFKVDWDGSLLERFVLDRFIYTISVSSDEKFLYGTSINLDGEKILVKYDLF